MNHSDKPLLKTLSGEISERPPIWLMRQAGRYLPEYRELRSQASAFLDFCYNPKLASEATLQPIRRFNFDGAILFSDILVVPDALGQNVTFEASEGPRLKPLSSPQELLQLKDKLDQFRIDRILETIDRVKPLLPSETTLIGFCGAPWTVASYMIAGKSTLDQYPARIFAYSYPNEFQSLIDLLVETSVNYLINQIDAGVEVIQIFDSWAGILPPLEFEKWCLNPLVLMIKAIRERKKDFPIIIFPRGVGPSLQRFMDYSVALGLDTTVNLHWINDQFPTSVVVQGNLDPIALASGGKALENGIDYILGRFKKRPYLFNLGHGILPQTPLENVSYLVKKIRGS